MAASGGYYLACAGTKIVAERTSIIGSIGVVGGKFAVGKALADIGINAETVAAKLVALSEQQQLQVLRYIEGLEAGAKRPLFDPYGLFAGHDTPADVIDEARREVWAEAEMRANYPVFKNLVYEWLREEFERELGPLPDKDIETMAAEEGAVPIDDFLEELERRGGA